MIAEIKEQAKGKSVANTKKALRDILTNQPDGVIADIADAIIAESGVDDSAKSIYLPKSNGRWSEEEGNSEWIPDPEFVPKNPKSNPDKLSWKQISEKYGVDRIDFNDGQPDFSPTSKGTVEIEDFSTERDDNFDAADEALAKKKGCTKADVRRWRKKNKYTWHERKDCRTMDKVPTCVHGNVPHAGGISEMKKEES